MEYVSIEKGIVSKVISKLLNKAVEKRIGIKPRIGINRLIFRREGEPDTVRIDLSLSMPTDVFERLLERIL